MFNPARKSDGIAWLDLKNADLAFHKLFHEKENNSYAVLFGEDVQYSVDVVNVVNSHASLLSFLQKR